MTNRDDWQCWYDERAAIYEYEAGKDRRTAEIVAKHSTWKHFPEAKAAGWVPER